MELLLRRVIEGVLARIGMRQWLRRRSVESVRGLKKLRLLVLVLWRDIVMVMWRGSSLWRRRRLVVAADVVRSWRRRNWSGGVVHGGGLIHKRRLLLLWLWLI